MLLMVKASEETETVIAIFGVSVVQFLKILKFSNAGFVPEKGEKLFVVLKVPKK